LKNRIPKFFAMVAISLIVFGSATALSGFAAGGRTIPADSTSDSLSLRLVSASPAMVRFTTPLEKTQSEWFSAELSAVSGTPAIKRRTTSFAQLLDRINGPAYAYSEQEKAYIARVVYAEARGEKFDGKVAVAAVVINRFESGLFGSTVKKVVLARNQFAVSRRYNDECMAAVAAAIHQHDVFPDDMYYFQASKSKHWRSFDYYTRIGHHSFYCA
jgi:spore germination cell wall hydrolase CwlJ-like protein